VTISRISSATNAGDTVTIGTHAAGDTIFILAYNDGSGTIPSLPAGWLNHHTLANSTIQGIRVGYRVAQSSSETSGTWTNADGLIAVVYRGSEGVVVPGVFSESGATSATITYGPTIAATRNRENVDQWFFGLAMQRVDTNALETAPSSMTNVTNLVGTGWEIVWHDTNADANSWSNANVVLSTSAAYRSAVVQIWEQPFYSAASGGARMVNVRGGADQ